MSSQSNQGLLTPYNCTVVLIDYQPQFAFTLDPVEAQTVISNGISFAKTARIFSIPTVLTTIGSKSFAGTILSRLQEVFPDQEPIDRSTMSIFEDSQVVEALEKFGRKKLIMAGLWTDFCVVLSALQALKAGYGVYVIADACGDVTSRAHTLAMKRIIHEGGVSMTWLQIHLEMLRNSMPVYASNRAPAAVGGLLKITGIDIQDVSAGSLKKFFKKWLTPFTLPPERKGGMEEEA
jgi:nicotinamidase-related amidase